MHNIYDTYNYFISIKKAILFIFFQIHLESKTVVRLRFSGRNLTFSLRCFPVYMNKLSLFQFQLSSTAYCRNKMKHVSLNSSIVKVYMMIYISGRSVHPSWDAGIQNQFTLLYIWRKLYAITSTRIQLISRFYRKGYLVISVRDFTTKAA